MPDQKASARLLAGFRLLLPAIRTVMADAGHQSHKLTRIVACRLVWLGRNLHFSKDYEFKVQTSETVIEVAATRVVPNHITPAQRVL